MTSSFQPKELQIWILRLLHQASGIQTEKITQLFINTYRDYCSSWNDPHWIETIRYDTRTLLKQMADAGFVDFEGDIVHLTLLGRASSDCSVSFNSSLRLIDVMNKVKIEQITPTCMPAIIQVLPESDAIRTPIMKKGHSENVRLNDVALRYGEKITQTLQWYCLDDVEVWQRCKRAAIIYDWLKGETVESIEKRYSPNPFQGVVKYDDLIGIINTTRLHLKSVYRLLDAKYPENSSFLKGVREVLLRLEFGLPADALPLTALPVPLERGQYLALYRAGCKNKTDIDSMNRQQLIDMVGCVAATMLLATPNKALNGTATKADVLTFRKLPEANAVSRQN